MYMNVCVPVCMCTHIVCLSPPYQPCALQWKVRERAGDVETCFIDVSISAHVIRTYILKEEEKEQEQEENSI